MKKTFFLIISVFMMSAAFAQTGADSTIANFSIRFQYLKAVSQAGNYSLEWKVNCIRSPHATMILERSTNGRIYSAIYSVTGSAIRCQQAFNYTDAAPAAGLNHYRLQMIDADGNSSYSSVAVLLNKISGIEMVNLLPTLVKDNAILNIASAEISKMQIVVSDVNGKQLMSRNVNLIAGSNQVDFNLSILPSGTYQMTGYTTDGQSKTIRFVKQ
jgi:hypothetical protein